MDKMKAYFKTFLMIVSGILGCLWWLIKNFGPWVPPPPSPVPPPPPPSPVPPDPMPPDLIPEVKQLLDAHNEMRRAHGLPPLILKPALVRAAQKQSDWQAKSRHVTHTDREGFGVGHRISVEDYLWTQCGENVAGGQRTVKEAMQAWSNSGPHFRNILRDWHDAGFGMSIGINGVHYWTAVFAIPANKDHRMAGKAEYIPAPLHFVASS